jgi:Leucine-rich repeat (LRR) protein
MDGIDGLSNLEVLNVSGNCFIQISFCNLPQLQYLQADRQKIEGLCFSNYSCESAVNLKKLSVTSNGITDIKNYSMFPSLEFLDLSYNKINDVNSILEVVKSVSSLSDIKAQTLIADRHLRHKIILASSNIKCINGNDVSFNERQFLINMHSTKRKKPGKN